ncbi:agmatine/peptidylarginine deiminase [Bradyrhizobium elkanii]
MPDEGAPHAATWMAFGADVELWGTKLLPVIRNNLASVAKAIAVHEPVKMLVREEDYDIAARLCGPRSASSFNRSMMCGCATRDRSS